MERARRFSISLTRRDNATLVVKAGVGSVSVAALRREAAVLATFTHPGVVAFVALEEGVNRGTECAALMTRLAGVHTLRTAPPATAVIALTRAGQMLATLAALHSRGWVHGGIHPTHVVVSPTGAARWCGLGGVRRATSSTRADEVRAAAQLAAESLDAVRSHGGHGRRSTRLVSQAMDVLADERHDAVSLTAALTRLLTGRPHRGVVRRALRSAETDGNLVGQEPASDSEYQVVPAMLDESVEHPVDLMW